MLIRSLHLIIVVAYLAGPLVALTVALRARRRGRPQLFSGLIATLLMGLPIGLGLCLIYAFASKGKIIPTQVLLAWYFATALLVLLKGFDALLRAGLRRLLALSGQDRKKTFAYSLRYLLFGLVRLALLALIVLPYAMAAIMTYRPKVAPRDDPRSKLGMDFERVAFRATDGMPIVGWWIPALPSRRATHWDQWGKDTVIVCPGLGANKSNQLAMCRQMVPGGFNVLIFDFRAHGESGGQLTSFGDIERRDVLGAVRWVRATHPQSSQKIFGVGASMGAAALIAAAADDSVEGKSIDAIATYAAYDDLNSLAASVAAQRFARPFDWLMLHLAYPVAAAHAGADLAHFSPANLTDRIWPRPMLFIHGVNDEIIDFDLGQNLYRRAPQPKYNYWIDKGTHNDILDNDTAARVVLEFFKAAKPIPVI